MASTELTEAQLADIVNEKVLEDPGTAELVALTITTSDEPTEEQA